MDKSKEIRRKIQRRIRKLRMQLYRTPHYMPMKRAELMDAIAALESQL